MTELTTEDKHYLEQGLFVPRDELALSNAGMIIYHLEPKNYDDLISEGLKVSFPEDLEEDLKVRTKIHPSHTNSVAFLPELFLPNSGNLPLANQDNLAREFVARKIRELRLNHVEGGISRTSTYLNVWFEHYKATEEPLLEENKYFYPTAATRLRVIQDMVGSANYIPGIGPYRNGALEVTLLSRDEENSDVGVWVLLYPKQYLNLAKK